MGFASSASSRRGGPCYGSAACPTPRGCTEPFPTSPCSTQFAPCDFSGASNGCIQGWNVGLGQPWSTKGYRKTASQICTKSKLRRRCSMVDENFTSARNIGFSNIFDECCQQCS